MLLHVGPHLYRNPIVQDVGSFLLSAEKSLGARTGETSISQLQLGHTKLALLRYVRKLTIIPFTVVPDGLQSSVSSHDLERRIIQRQRESYGKAILILDRLRSLPPDLPSDITPNLKHITFGSCLFANTRAGERILQHFNDDVRPLKLLLLQKAKPKNCCIYADDSGESIDIKNLPYEQYIDGTLPECVTIHTELMDPVQIVWGTMNRIVIRQEIDVFPRMWPELKPKIPNIQRHLEDLSRGDTLRENRNQTGEKRRPSAVEVYDWKTGITWPAQTEYHKPFRILDNGDIHKIVEIDSHTYNQLDGPVDPRGNFAVNPTKRFEERILANEGVNYDEETLIRILTKSIQTSVPDWLFDQDECDIFDQMSFNTSIEIYGLEKGMGRPAWGDEFYDELNRDSEDSGYYTTPSEDEDVKEAQTVIDRRMDAENDLSYWAGYSDHRFSLNYRQYIRERQRKHLRHLEYEIRGANDEPCQFFDPAEGNNPNGPEIKFYLGRENPGCKSCTQGKGDRWLLDTRPIPARTPNPKPQRQPRNQPLNRSAGSLGRPIRPRTLEEVIDSGNEADNERT